ncbi:MAG: hypothetical protein R3C19_25145 [Planctomycetaceae bacterium]
MVRVTDFGSVRYVPGRTGSRDLQSAGSARRAGGQVPRLTAGLLPVILLTTFLVPCETFAQVPQSGDQASAAGADDEPDPLPLDIKVLMEASPQYSLMAQGWTRVFQDVGYSVVFDASRNNERPGIEDVTFNKRRSVKVVGQLDRSGTLQFGDRKFKQTEPEQLRTYLARLARYGAKGPPQESPTWGLTDEQFKIVVTMLSGPVTDPVTTSSPAEAIESLKLSDSFRIRYTPSARRLAFGDGAETDATPLEPQGLSQGTTTAIVLAQFGLGFRPMRNPDGAYVLEIDAGDESSNLWPVGWRNTEPLNRRIPNIYRSLEVGNLEDADLTGLIQLLSNRLEIPWFSSPHDLRAKGIRLSELTYSRKPDKLPPSSLLRKIGDKYEMGLEVRVDETGRPFLWVTTAEQNDTFRARFSHVKPR